MACLGLAESCPEINVQGEHANFFYSGGHRDLDFILEMGQWNLGTLENPSSGEDLETQ